MNTSSSEDNFFAEAKEFLSDEIGEQDSDDQNHIQEKDLSNLLYSPHSFPAPCASILASTNNGNSIQQSYDDYNAYKECDHEIIHRANQIEQEVKNRGRKFPLNIFTDSEAKTAQNFPPRFEDIQSDDTSISVKNYIQDVFQIDPAIGNDYTEDGKQNANVSTQNSIEANPNNYMELRTIFLNQNPTISYTNQTEKERSAQIHLTQPMHAIYPGSQFHLNQPANTNITAPQFLINQPTNTSVEVPQFHLNQLTNTSVTTPQFHLNQPANTSVTAPQFHLNQPANTSVTAPQFHLNQPTNTSVTAPQFHLNQPTNTSATTPQFHLNQPANTSVTTPQFHLNQPTNTSVEVPHFDEQNEDFQSADVAGCSIHSQNLDGSRKKSRKDIYGRGVEVQRLRKKYVHYGQEFENCLVYKAIKKLSPGKIQEPLNAIGDDYNEQFFKNDPKAWPKFNRDHKRNEGIAIWFFEDLLDKSVGQWLLDVKKLPF